MSAIFGDQEDKILLFCKGADRYLRAFFPLFFAGMGEGAFGSFSKGLILSWMSLVLCSRRYLKKGVLLKVKQHIKKYAEASLRTLVVAYRELDEQEYIEWEEEFVKG